jgi:hypothetical protein
MSQGARRAGSEEWRALYEAKMGKRTVVATLLCVSAGSGCRVL